MESEIDAKVKTFFRDKLKEIRETFGMSRDVFAREANILGCSYFSVRYRSKKYGLKLRPKKG